MTKKTAVPKSNPRIAELWKTMIDSQIELRKLIRAAGGDIVTHTTVIGDGLLCMDHLQYRGHRAPKNGCEECLKVYEDRQRRINEKPRAS